MRKLDLYWLSNRAWYSFTDDEDATPYLLPDAPAEAKASYEHYLEQINQPISERLRKPDKIS